MCIRSFAVAAPTEDVRGFGNAARSKRFPSFFGKAMPAMEREQRNDWAISSWLSGGDRRFQRADLLGGVELVAGYFIGLIARLPEFVPDIVEADMT